MTFALIERQTERQQLNVFLNIETMNNFFFLFHFVQASWREKKIRRNKNNSLLHCNKVGEKKKLYIPRKNLLNNSSMQISWKKAINWHFMMNINKNRKILNFFYDVEFSTVHARTQHKEELKRNYMHTVRMERSCDGCNKKIILFLFF